MHGKTHILILSGKNVLPGFSVQKQPGITVRLRKKGW